jgi:Helix-turn-helix of DDE superfamily endonuclease
MNILRAMKNQRLLRAVTGLDKAKFEELVEAFGQIYHNRVPSGLNWLGAKRQRAIGGGAQYTLKTDTEKVFFVLFYMKCYPTFDLLGLFFDLDKSSANRCLHSFLPIIETVLGYKMALPMRKIGSMEEFIEHFGDIHQLIIDGTERPIQRSKNYEKQKDNYSGKKNDILENTSLRRTIASEY